MCKQNRETQSHNKKMNEIDKTKKSAEALLYDLE